MASAYGTCTRSDSIPPYSTPESGCIPESDSTGYAGQLAVRPPAQARHRPQHSWNDENTSCPTVTLETPGPTATTSATASWPTANPSGTAGPALISIGSISQRAT